MFYIVMFCPFFFASISRHSLLSTPIGACFACSSKRSQKIRERLLPNLVIDVAIYPFRVVVYAKTIEGVILYNHDTCAYWPEGSEYDDNVTPLCSSVDGKTGYGAPGGACAVCALNQYGSVEKGKGKACKNMRSLYILRSGEFMPLLLSLPPTSLRPYSDFITTAFAARRRPIYSGVVQIGLKRVDNGSNTYSVATFRLLQKFDGEELLQIKQYADGFREQIKAMNQQRALEAELGNSEAISDAVDHGYSSADDGEHFCITDNEALDGDREAWPA